MKRRGLVMLASALALLSGCEREQRRFDVPPAPASGVDATPMSSLHAGPAASPVPGVSAASTEAASPASAASGASAAAPADAAASTGPSGATVLATGSMATLGITNRHEENAYAVAQGKRLFRWYNCSGCHANGGGGMGPPLMDDKWIYGAEPAQIVATILQGRPNGMPSFDGRIPEDQVWEIAAYVRSMSGQLRTDVAPSRSDSLSSGPPELRRDKAVPKPASAGR